MYWRPGRQKGLRKLYGPFVNPGDLVFDVGAHLGDRSVAFAALGAQVVALEPQPRIAKCLQWLVGKHERITVRPEAVGRTIGRANLAVSRLTPTVSTLAETWRKRLPEVNPSFRNIRWEQSVDVPVTTLDVLIKTYGIPGFCKIDVEGYEAEVLGGLSQPVPGVSLEFVSGSLDVATDCVRRLDDLGSYEFNAVLGERRQFVFNTWLRSDRLLKWLDTGADGASSGDLYARLMISVR